MSTPRSQMCERTTRTARRTVPGTRVGHDLHMDVKLSTAPAEVKVRVPFNAPRSRIAELTRRAEAMGLSRQAYMELVLFGEILGDARYKESPQDGLPMTG